LNPADCNVVGITGSPTKKRGWQVEASNDEVSAMESLESIQERLINAVPGVRLEILPNASPIGQRSLLVDGAHAAAVARWLRDDPGLRLDYASNVTGVDWPERTVQEKHRIHKVIDGVDREFEEQVERRLPGYLECVYHLYSMALKHGPVILRLRTGNRTDDVTVPSLTPVWRSCELQEREIYDLFGVRFEGHPDLRRILMWDGFEDHPMRRDYVDPDDYEYEPTPHDSVLARVKQRASQTTSS
jgi:NADH-quinone oxidoreductase subunit C